MTDTTRTVFNFAPNLDFRYRFSKVSQLRITYRGRSSQLVWKTCCRLSIIPIR